jgi:hypothetical protein
MKPANFYAPPMGDLLAEVMAGATCSMSVKQCHLHSGETIEHKLFKGAVRLSLCNDVGAQPYFRAGTPHQRSVP